VQRDGAAEAADLLTIAIRSRINDRRSETARVHPGAIDDPRTIDGRSMDAAVLSFILTWSRSR